MNMRWMVIGLLMAGGLGVSAAPPAGPTNEQKAVTAQAAMGNLATALEAFKTDNGRYPRTNEGLRSLLEKANTLPKWKGPYVNNRLALMDPWKRAYVYKSPGTANPKGYDLSANGPDGKPASGDDVVYAAAAK